MNETEHTPGPWSTRFEEAITVRSPDRSMIALCTNLKGEHGTMGRRNPDEVAANARLIAASPDLLAALEATLAYIDDYGRKDSGELTRQARRPFEQAAAALAKAKGGA